MGSMRSSGLGLYITKQIVEAMGGKVWVESPGEKMGSTFYFTVPVAQGESGVHVINKDGTSDQSFHKLAQA